MLKYAKSKPTDVGFLGGVQRSRTHVHSSNYLQRCLCLPPSLLLFCLLSSVLCVLYTLLAWFVSSCAPNWRGLFAVCGSTLLKPSLAALFVGQLWRTLLLRCCLWLAIRREHLRARKRCATYTYTYTYSCIYTYMHTLLALYTHRQGLALLVFTCVLCSCVVAAALCCYVYVCMCMAVCVCTGLHGPNVCDPFVWRHPAADCGGFPSLHQDWLCL